MGIEETVSGQQCAWSLIKKLGEGDAGEVYLVESLLEKRRAILKRPVRGGFGADVTRQAAQIENEGKLLRTLEGLSIPLLGGELHVPALLDHAERGAEFSERYFIIQERANGLDLDVLNRAASYGLNSLDGSTLLDGDHTGVLAVVANRGKIPEVLLLRALEGIFALFEQSHSLPSGGGVIWNDVKPEHLFWDPSAQRFTVIDWGNGQFLEADGISRDRMFSPREDYRQLVDEMGRFLRQTDSSLAQRLQWPEKITPEEADPETLAPLRGRVQEALEAASQTLETLRARENELLNHSGVDSDHPEQIRAVQSEIAAQCERPDMEGALRYAVQAAIWMTENGNLDELNRICTWAIEMPGSPLHRWSQIERMAAVAARIAPADRLAFSRSLQYALNEDWEASLWELLGAARSDPEPAWWYDLSTHLRSAQLDLEPDTLTPLLTLKRTVMTLQSGLQKLRDQPDAETQIQAVEKLIVRLREWVIPNWSKVEPDPPFSTLDYGDMVSLLDEIGRSLPRAQQTLQVVLSQPRAQAQIVLDAWERREYALAARGLRRLLLWDPDRRRVWLAEHAILRTPDWVQDVSSGPLEGEAIADFVTRLELDGRDLRNQVGPASWLDLILAGLRELRRGTPPAELLDSFPGILAELPWLAQYERARAAARRGLTLMDKRTVDQRLHQHLNGVHSGQLGGQDGFLLAESLDTWSAEVRGSSARVFNGYVRTAAGGLRPMAVKIMRPNKIEYAMPLFAEEARVLRDMRDVPGAAALLECGFIQLSDDSDLPHDRTDGDGRELRGKVERMGVDQVDTYLDVLEERVKAGWLPYLGEEIRPSEDCLMLLCDAGHTRGRFPSVAFSLQMAMALTEILIVAHQRNIVYRDHKILHFYWQETAERVYIIDWNVAHLVPGGISDAERQFDVVQFCARGLHHILTGRVAPGALPLGPTRPDEIEQAQHQYSVQWTYDDRRLPYGVRDLLEEGLSGKITRFDDLYAELKACLLQLSADDY